LVAISAVTISIVASIAELGLGRLLERFGDESRLGMLVGLGAPLRDVKAISILNDLP